MIRILLWCALVACDASLRGMSCVLASSFASDARIHLTLRLCCVKNKLQAGKHFGKATNVLANTDGKMISKVLVVEILLFEL